MIKEVLRCIGWTLLAFAGVVLFDGYIKWGLEGYMLLLKAPIKPEFYSGVTARHAVLAGIAALAAYMICRQVSGITVSLICLFLLESAYFLLLFRDVLRRRQDS